MTGYEILIVIVSVVCLAGLTVALVMKGIAIVKKVRAFQAEKQLLEESDGYLLDIVQNGKVVHIECQGSCPTEREAAAQEE